MAEERFEYGTDKTVTVSAVTLDGAAVTGGGTGTYALKDTGGATIAGGSLTWNAAKASYVGYLAASTWSAQLESTKFRRSTMGRLVVVLTESGVTKTWYHDAFFCYDN